MFFGHGSSPVRSAFGWKPALAVEQYAALASDHSPGPEHGVQTSTPPRLYSPAAQATHFHQSRQYHHLITGPLARHQNPHSIIIIIFYEMSLTCRLVAESGNPA